MIPPVIGQNNSSTWENPHPCEQSSHSEPLPVQQVYLLGSLARTTAHTRFPQLEWHHSFEPRSTKHLGENLRPQPSTQAPLQTHEPYVAPADDLHSNSSPGVLPYLQRHARHSVTSCHPKLPHSLIFFTHLLIIALKKMRFSHFSYLDLNDRLSLFLKCDRPVHERNRPRHYSRSMHQPKRSPIECDLNGDKLFWS
jgi:hypothetical protein